MRVAVFGVLVYLVVFLKTCHVFNLPSYHQDEATYISTACSTLQNATARAFFGHFTHPQAAKGNKHTLETFYL
jgi:hypothetical protein